MYERRYRIGALVVAFIIGFCLGVAATVALAWFGVEWATS